MSLQGPPTANGNHFDIQAHDRRLKALEAASGPRVIPAPMTVEANRKLIKGVDGRQERALCWTQGEVQTLKERVFILEATVKALITRLESVEDEA